MHDLLLSRLFVYGTDDAKKCCARIDINLQKKSLFQYKSIMIWHQLSALINDPPFSRSSLCALLSSLEKLWSSALEGEKINLNESHVFSPLGGSRAPERNENWNDSRLLAKLSFNENSIHDKWRQSDYLSDNNALWWFFFLSVNSVPFFTICAPGQLKIFCAFVLTEREWNCARHRGENNKLNRLSFFVGLV